MLQVVKPLCLAVLLFCVVPAFAQKPTWRVKVIINGYDPLLTTSYVTRELRSLPDVIVVESDADVILNLEVTAPYLSYRTQQNEHILSYAILDTLNRQDAASLATTSDANSELFKLYRKYGLLALHSLRTCKSDDLHSTIKEIVAALDGIIEIHRKLKQTDADTKRVNPKSNKPTQ